MFGGLYRSGEWRYHLQDTWSWDGSVWSQVANTGPDARLHHSMVYDPVSQGVVLFGGERYLGRQFGDTWVWRAGQWTLLTEDGPSPRNAATMAWDPAQGSINLVGGLNYCSETWSDTWAWDGTKWLPIADGSPSRQGVSAMVYDLRRGVTVLHERVHCNSIARTWEFNGDAWEMRSANGPLPNRVRPMMVYDEARGMSVLFTDDGGTGVRTWGWDGKDWMVLSDTGPSQRSGCAMAYDLDRQVVVLFAGRENGTYRLMSDTWEWGGTAWTRKESENRAFERFDHAMAFDPVRRTVMAFGGTDGVHYKSGTLAWSGNGWSTISNTGPELRVGHRMICDAARGRVLLFGGYQGGNEYDGLWEWNGSLWRQSNLSGIGARREFGFSYDSRRRRAVLFGGDFDGSVRGETWELLQRHGGSLAIIGPQP